MKRFSLVSQAALAFLLAWSAPSKAILNGAIVDPADDPQIMRLDSDRPSHCTTVVVGPRVVITAASCVRSRDGHGTLTALGVKDFAEDQRAETCGINSDCSDDSRRRSPGQSANARAFFESIAGTYRIVRVGGEEPISDEPGFVDASDEIEAFLAIGYCGPDGCVPGNARISYNTTSVSMKQSGDTKAYAIETGTQPPERYDWEVTPSKILYRNYQLHLGSSSAPLEFELSKKQI